MTMMKRRRMCLPTTSSSRTDGWPSLPGELLEKICEHLPTDADHLHMHQVCANWRACTSPPTAFRPWILARRRSGPTPCSSYSLWLPRRLLVQRKVELGASPAGLPYCRGASRGWLALADDARSPTRLVLWDPASGAEVQLPPMARVSQVFLSGDPLGPPGWVAVASQCYGNSGAHSCLFWRPGDADWSVLCERGTAGIESAAFHAGWIFYLDWMRTLVACELSGGLGAPASIRIRNIGGLVNRLCSCDNYHGVRGAHMVTCAGELLLVVLRKKNNKELGHGHPSFAEVYKLEWAPETERLLQLGDRVTDLGEHSLFLGRGESFALSANEYPAIKRNHVYGVAVDCNYSRNKGHPDWAFSFDLGSDTLKEIPYPTKLSDDGADWRPLLWFCLRSPLRIELKNQQQ